MTEWAGTPVGDAPPSGASPQDWAGTPVQQAARPEEGPADNPAFRKSYETYRATGGNSAQVLKGIPIVGGLAQRGAAHINAAISGTPYETELGAMRAADEATEREHPYGSAALQAGGGLAAFGGGPRPTMGATTIMPPGGPAMAGASRLTGVGYQPPVGAAVLGGTTGGLARRMATSGAANAVLGGADAASHDQDIGTGAAAGGALGAAGPLAGRVLGAGANWARGNSRASRVAPTEQALHGAADRGFDAARASGLVVHPAGIADLSNIIEHDLLNGAPGAGSFHPDQAPETFRVLREMRQAPPAAPAGRYGTAPQPTTNTDANGLINLREQLQHAASSPDPREGKAAGHALNRLENYLESIPASHVMSGDANAFRTNYAGGRASYGAAQRSGRFSQDVLENASRNADVAHAGENLGNNTRQRLNAVIKSNQRGSELGRGLNDDEVASMDKVARGTGFANGARKVQSWTGGLKRGSVASLIGGAIGSNFGPWGIAAGMAAPHAVSDVARRAAEASTVRGARGIDEQLRMRSPLGESVEAARNQAGATNNAAMQGGAFAARAAGTPIAEMIRQMFEDQPEEPKREPLRITVSKSRNEAGQ